MTREARSAAENVGEACQGAKENVLQKVPEAAAEAQAEGLTGKQNGEQIEAVAQAEAGNPADASEARGEKGEESRTEGVSEQESSKEVTALAVAEEKPAELSMMTPEEKMERFQLIMNHIIGQALEANNEKLSQEISGLVNQRLTEDLEDLMRIRDEREEERFRQLDETIRSCQRMSQGKAEAAATKVPFLKRKSFGRAGRL